MKLTKGQALELHWQMWSDMQNELGDTPSEHDREGFKRVWCKDHFPSEYISSYCFLCEYDNQFEDRFCTHCPIDWSSGGNDHWGCSHGEIRYDMSPISDILALPEREGV